ncbi:segment polarity protein dishevelled homolog DVL-3-like isoform X2 [Actinia tenebrosa]|uniref:Segment polarity protein dishevelled homolog DVL-3-like isoform X2 n=1 Tax=Actinia tenebrosa TaxID=6105 RepID=A0A6P8IA99_ACTTE|nr:segment polarity protein dishevelled homolog DVL-3-like isoform X2 [Actinia tenebrosa]
MEETKVIYHIDDEDTPYLVKLGKHPDIVTLGDFKNVLNRPTYKFFFKSMDDDFGVVKEEISEDEMRLPCFNGRVVAWLVTSDNSSISGSGGGDLALDQQSILSSPSDLHVPVQRTVGIGDSRPPSFHPNGGHSTTGDFDSEVDSTISSRRGGSKRREKHNSRGNEGGGHPRHRSGPRQPGERFDATSTMSSDIESTSYMDSSDDQSSVSRFSSTTEGSHLLSGRHRRRRRRPRMPRVQRCSSFSTITESTMSLNIITITLNMEKVNFLGISIVGQSNKRGDGGIYVGSVMKGGAVDLDGRIEPGDMLLQVNDVNFENMTNDDAVRVLREMVHKPGPITLTVAKCWDPTPKGYFTLPHSDPVRPIDTSAWVQHTTAMNQFAAQQVAQYGKPPNSQSLSTMTSTSSSMTSSLPESDRYTELGEGEPLTLNTDMVTVVKAMAAPDSGLDIRDRMWLKITIPNAFIGSDVVDWLYSRVEGFSDRREARKYACNLLKAGYIRHTVNKITFSEQCYYVFGDLCGNMAALSLTEHEGDQDTLGPLPPQQHAIPWMTGGPPAYGYHQMPSYSQPMPTDPKNVGYAHSFYSGTSAHSGSQSPHSGSGSSKRGSERQADEHRSSGSGSDRSGSSKGKGSGQSVRSEVTAPPLVPNAPRPLDQVPESIASSRNSFRMAMTNPCEYFVDVM